MTLGPLLALQALDLELDQLVRLIESPPERQVYESAREAASTTARALQQVVESQTQTEEDWARTEAATAEIDRHSERLRQQLRSVVVVREAEALQHELETLAARRGELDDTGLEALERLESLAEERRMLEQRLPGEQAAEAAALTALEQVRSELRSRHAERSAERVTVAAGVPEAVRLRYEQLRQHLGGVGAAELEGNRCTGCRLDVSRGELEALRAAPADEVVECPNCGRLLVR